MHIISANQIYPHINSAQLSGESIQPLQSAIDSALARCTPK